MLMAEEASVSASSQPRMRLTGNPRVVKARGGGVDDGPDRPGGTGSWSYRPSRPLLQIFAPPSIMPAVSRLAVDDTHEGQVATQNVVLQGRRGGAPAKLLIFHTSNDWMASCRKPPDSEFRNFSNVYNSLLLFLLGRGNTREGFVHCAWFRV